MNELALFAGAGGGILGGQLLGWRTVCAVEIDAFCREVLLRRQLDGCLPRFPVWDDVRTFDGRPWRGCVDVISGGFPCQDISCAGKGAGLDGQRSGLWREFARIIGEIRPAFAFVENSPMLTLRGFARILADLAALGYDARWGVVSAADAIWLNGTPCLDHLRERIFIRAHAQCPEWREMGNPNAKQCEKQCGAIAETPQQCGIGRAGWWESEPAVGRVADGMAYRVDRLSAIGNGQVPAVAKLASELLSVP
jgi:DNA (cytosine-5)-methyltransferase 1